MPEIKHRKCNDLRRWKLELSRGWSVRLHHWVKGDPEPYQHAHPWNFLTIVISGGYDDVADGRVPDFVRAPAIRFRSLNWRHSIVNVRPRTWSIIITGPKVALWRFWVWGQQVTQEEWDGRACD